MFPFLLQYFSVNGIDATMVPLPTMEANKSFDLVYEVARRAEIFKLNRCPFCSSRPQYAMHACCCGWQSFI